ncbi:MAG TPA: hypothetical protein VMU50_04950 [Polyangia bacterium]|nr:hypothetical protein [Polyangia bacterium]
MYGRIIFTGAILIGLPLAGTVVRAEICPNPAADDSQARRALAKDWFARAEESENAGNRDAAVRQYACSLRLVPHPSTAFNLAEAAERSGDPLMAADAYHAYLRLMPDAPDRTAVETRIGHLEKELQDLRQEFDDPAPPSRPPPRPRGIVKPAPAARYLAEADADVLPLRLATPSASSAPAVQESRMPPWPLLAGAAASAATGLVFNLVARAKMTTCRDPVLRASDRPSADAACSSAVPYAYGSYALLGLSGALGAVGVVFVFRNGSDASDRTSVSLAPTVGGGAVTISGTF